MCSALFVLMAQHQQGTISILKMLSYPYRDPMVKIRQFHDHLIFNMGILIPGKDMRTLYAHLFICAELYIELGPRLKLDVDCGGSVHIPDQTESLLPADTREPGPRFNIKTVFSGVFYGLVIWHYRSQSSLVQAMVCSLMALSHCLSQCWLVISKIHPTTFTPGKFQQKCSGN